MPDLPSVSGIVTHFYKIAHLQLLEVHIYTATDPTQDQLLLELELQIRDQHPRILLTYYNKCLYQFKLGHIEAGVDLLKPGDTSSAYHGRLDELYPKLTFKREFTVNAASLAKPSKGLSSQGTNKKDSEPLDDQLAFVSLTFFKAVKKMIVFNLCQNSNNYLFGNYLASQIQGDSSRLTVIQIDPVVLENGDLIVSLFQTNRLDLWFSSVIQLSASSMSLTKNFVIYVIPSGLRCHLYDTSDYHLTFTLSPPKSSSNLLRLLKLSTGIDLSRRKEILWAKLIPNLQHLNNQTSNISHFIHEVDNKKFILWPWELCLLQFGDESTSDTALASPSCNTDPMDLLNRFMDFSIATKERHLHSKGESFLPDVPISTAPQFSQNSSANGVSPISTGKSSGNAAFMDDTSVKLETPVMSMTDDFSYQDFHQTPSANSVKPELSEVPKWNEERLETREATANEKFHSDLPKVKILGDNEKVGEDIADDDDDDDLFGESSGSEINDDNVAKSNTKSELPVTDTDLNPIVSKLSDTEELSANHVAKEGTDSAYNRVSTPGLDSPSTFVNIPRDQMISDKDIGSYKDPGAPLPIVPTPVVPASAVFTPSISASEKNFFKREKRPTNDRPPENAAVKEGTGYVFSPIRFNPVIKSSIDTKYGKGGKFYVEHDEASDPEHRNRRFRETSVSHGSPLQFSNELAARQNDMSKTSERKAMKQSNEGNPEENLSFTSKELSAPIKDQDVDFEVQEAAQSGMPDHQVGRRVENEYLQDGSASIDSRRRTHEKDDDDDLDEDYDDDDDDDAMEDSMNEEDEEEDEEESDEDEEYGNEDLDTSPLRLNTLNQDPTIVGHNSLNDTVRPFPPANSNIDMAQQDLSPYPSGHKQWGGKDEIPPGPAGPVLINDPVTQSLSPLPIYPNDTKEELAIISTDSKDIDTSIPATSAGSPVASTSSAVGESSNCLPLILRSINVLTIPPVFFLRKEQESWDAVTMLSGFDMDVVEDYESLDVERYHALTVKGKDLAEFLKWITSNLIFDFGSFEARHTTRSKISEEDHFYHDGPCVETEPSELMLKIFKGVFPLSLRVSLDELRFGYSETNIESSKKIDENTVDNHLGFLGQLNDGNENDLPDIKSIFWDSIYHENPENERNAELYTKHLTEAEQRWSSRKNEDHATLPTSDAKVKILKPNSEIINIDFVGLRFWRYLDLKPINHERSFQVLLISPTTTGAFDNDVFERGNLSFLSLLKNNYKNNHFGDIKKLSLLAPENRADLEGVSNGTILLEQSEAERGYTKFYHRLGKRLRALAELIKLDLINKNNRFDFDRPLLLLFINFDDTIGSISQLSKICRDFQASLNIHQLSLVEVLSHVIPWQSILKQANNRRRLKYLSSAELTNLSMMLYNKCPNSRVRYSTQTTRGTAGLFTRLLKERPQSLNFKVSNRRLYNDDGATLAEDLFLHVAYERSIDRKWVSAAWSDPHGVVTYTKSWYCASKRGDNTNGQDIGQIISELWDTSSSLLKYLGDEESRSACGTSGKRFLVLTRVNSILPDDELVFWKRLTSKYKEISLIVLSANRLPKITFGFQGKHATNAPVGERSPANPDQMAVNKSYNMCGLGGTDLIKAFPIPYTSSPGTSEINNIASPINSSTLHVHSPHQFVNAPGNFLSPQDSGVQSHNGESNIIDEHNLYIRDKNLDVVGFVPQTSLPCSNSPTRLGMKTGYLIKEIGDEESTNFMTFEVSLLSCSSQWNLNTIMKILLNQFKKLIHLNYIIGICPLTSKDETASSAHRTKLRSMTPWHINAIGKSLDYLVHVSVNDDV